MPQSLRQQNVQRVAQGREFADAILDKLIHACAKTAETAYDHDWYIATALAARDRVINCWIDSKRREEDATKQVYYLSVEFLIGRLLFDTLTNLRLVDEAQVALASLGVDINALRKLEPDAALGNGGLGRLAACYMDSMAALDIPASGYGIRYEQGLFKQQIIDGSQQEVPDDWLEFGNPWEFARPEIEYSIRFGGSVGYVGGAGDDARAIWQPAERVLAVAYDTPLVGWRGRRVNPLRLWRARATMPLQLAAFNQGDYVGAIAARAQTEAISRVLYPSDATPEGQELRLRQEYFFTSASLQDIVHRHLLRYPDLTSLPQHAAIQMNDTHPSIAVAELMRLLIDEYGFAWEQAWTITQATLSYTNHTLLPEALESWPVSLLGRLLPRHLQIIYLINWHYLREVGGGRELDAETLAALSLIHEDGERRVRMGHLAFIGSHKVNGVSALHTELMTKTVFRDLAAASPGRIVNKTNGISFRRWLFEANPRLTDLVTKTIGEAVLDDPMLLLELEGVADKPAFVDRYADMRLQNKIALTRRVGELTGLTIDPHAIFDVQIKRIHEYKRQLLNILETIALFHELRGGAGDAYPARVKMIAGKAAPSYLRAKLIIRLANDVGRRINSDPGSGDRLKLVFLPNYSVSLAEEIVCASDVSEQISTAGMEASGTGNMKLALNGALTLGTLDGANIEIRDHVRDENIFIFGLTAAEVAVRRQAHLTGSKAVEASPRLAAVVDSLATGAFSPEEPDRYRPLVDSLLGEDPFLVAADFDAYWDAQRAVEAKWRDPAAWWRSAILNTARMGWFSSDRAIREYASEIWDVKVS